MKITIERKWKKADYTIGRMYVDGVFMCNTLEPVDRGLLNGAKPGYLASDEWKKAAVDARRMKVQFKAGTTAIPKGSYRLEIRISAKFKGKRAFVRDVPGFEAILIHEGNTKKDTAGCILLGENSLKGHVMKSKTYVNKLTKMIEDARLAGDVVVLRITN